MEDLSKIKDPIELPFIKCKDIYPGRSFINTILQIYTLECSARSPESPESLVLSLITLDDSAAIRVIIKFSKIPFQQRDDLKALLKVGSVL